ncbi:MAG: 4Fe-4S dicluster domain-containing protein, partial [Phormidesmis sp.]
MPTTDSPLKLDTSLPTNEPTPSESLSFDSSAPPQQSLIDACVHCGFCLPTCPSYRVLGKETDSPRGRIYLMDAINKGEAPLSPTSVGH